jgi:tetratricopeptide (TPR) repeat protein
MTTSPVHCRHASACRAVLAIAFLLVAATNADAQRFSDARELLATGEYSACVELSGELLDQRPHPRLFRLKIESQLTLGRYADALTTFNEARERFPFDLRLGLLAYEVLLHNDQPREADRLLKQIHGIIQRQPALFDNSSSLVDVGRFFLLMNWDSRQVLKVFFDRAKGLDPSNSDAYLASGELALAKHDYQLAAEEFQQGAKIDPQSADLEFGIARAFAKSDWKRAAQSLEAALDLNPQHVDALLFAVDHAIDGEQYAQAEELLKRVEQINALHPLAWSYRAVLAELNAEPVKKVEFRTAALVPWSTNPAVDHLIGRKLSEKYRFATGAEHQRTALEFDPTYLPAKIQLSQDLLRLGQEDEGWRLADEVADADQYDILAHNLSTLEKRIKGFHRLTGEGFVLRMQPREADLYGPEVLRLLAEAKETLCPKYGVELPAEVIVEIFPQQQDFAIRTFGLPGGAGYLGVCFGPVITATSPAAQGESPANWQAVLWHELCHVVTLTKTNNKMPRWLSEGISVYEERERNPTWGQRMNPAYREMTLSDDLTPVHALSSAFLESKSGLHLQYAYYESSMVVEYLISEHGLEKLLQVLTDLGVGMPINDALRRVTGSLEQLDEEFAKYLVAKANSLAPDLDWEKPPADPSQSLDEMLIWIDAHDDNFYALQARAKLLMREAKWSEAKEPLERLLAAYPENVETDNAYTLLARCHAALGETDEQQERLSQLTERDDDCLDAYLQLIRFAEQAEDWPALAKYARQALAVNPLLRTAHSALAEASAALNHPQEAIRSYNALLRFEATDMAEVHFRLARLLQQTGEFPMAKRHVLEAIEAAPRYRAALKLLLELNDTSRSNIFSDNTFSDGEQP